MSTYTQILYQIVFSTKFRKQTLLKEKCSKLYSYIGGIIKNKKCMVYIINGTEDHIHILTHLHPSVSLSDLVKDIKIASSKMIKEEKIFPNFTHWQIGYSAFTYSIDAKENLIKYIKNQEEHHRKRSFKEEYINLLNEFSIIYDEKYIF